MKKEKIELSLRKIEGRLSRLLSPEFGYCYRCERTWNTCDGHSTLFTENSGCFPLCEQCWGELNPKERLPYYRLLFNEWVKQGEKDMSLWVKIEKSVLDGK